MIVQFIYEALLGIVGIPAVLIFGPQGGVVMVLLVGTVFLKKRKFDEEDKILFRKVNISSVVLLLVFILIIYVLLFIHISIHNFKEVWLYLLGFGFSLAHGLMGLWYFRQKR